MIEWKFTVFHFPGLLVKDYVTELEKYFKKRVTCTNIRNLVFQISEYKCYAFSNDTNTMETHITIDGLICNEFKLLKLTTKSSDIKLPEVSIYTDKLGIKSKKLKDIQSII
jgi:hypothetical protein|uniref:Uncharacterized protein n=1 Tax=Sipha flava TaxID=143950 RepID=A0A2S2QVK4_9HEMI